MIAAGGAVERGARELTVIFLHYRIHSVKGFLYYISVANS